MANKYATGRAALGICDRCGGKYPYLSLVPDGYQPNLRVHPSCRDEPHPADKPFDASEGIALKNPRPDRDDDSPGAIADHSGTARAGSANSLTLASTASNVPNAYVGGTLSLTSGAGSAQARTVAAYDGGTKVATVSPAWGPEYLSLPGSAGNYASTPDSAALDALTANLDLRVKAALVDWSGADYEVFMGKGSAADPNRLFALYTHIGTDQLEFYRSIAGSARFAAGVDLSTGFVDGSTHWVRVTHNATNGDVKFYKSDDYDPVTEDGTWTQVGGTKVIATGAVDTGNTALYIGTLTGADFLASGKVHYAEVRNGIDGTIAAKFDPFSDGAQLGDLSFQASTGEVWTINQSGGTPAALTGLPDATTGYTVDSPDTLAEAMGFTNSFGGGT